MKTAIDHREVERLAEFTLTQKPSPVVRFRLLRDVLRAPLNDAEVSKARAQLDDSIWVKQLASEQQADGGWGAFHSRRAQTRQKIATTEVGVQRALALGLDASHPILQKAEKYIVDILDGRIAFPDNEEKNDRWQTGVRLFLAATLASIQPEHTILNEERQLWLEVARRSFLSGRYREEDEIQAHAELTGASVKGSYLRLRGRYQIKLLGSATELIPAWLGEAWLEWLWELPEGIGYLSQPLSKLPPNRAAGPLDRWFISQELLAQSFPGWGSLAMTTIEWLWAQREAPGLWDLGSRPAYLAYFPLSDSWRRPQDRVNDWTTRILALIRWHPHRGIAERL